jgi:hypothetical protein
MALELPTPASIKKRKPASVFATVFRFSRLLRDCKSYSFVPISVRRSLEAVTRTGV